MLYSRSLLIIYFIDSRVDIMPLPTRFLVFLPKGRVASPTDHDVKVTRPESANFLSSKVSSDAQCPLALPAPHATAPQCKQTVPVPGAWCAAAPSRVGQMTLAPAAHCLLTPTSTHLGLQHHPRAWPFFLLEGKAGPLLCNDLSPPPWEKRPGPWPQPRTLASLTTEHA